METNVIEVGCKIVDGAAAVFESETEIAVEVSSNDVSEKSIAVTGEVAEVIVPECSLQSHPDDISPQVSIHDAVQGMSVELSPELQAIRAHGLREQDIEIFGNKAVTLFEHSKTLTIVLIGWLFTTFGLLPNSEAGDRYIPAILQYLKSRGVKIGRSTLYEYINTYLSMQEMPKYLNSEQLAIFNGLNFTSKRFIARLRDPQHILDVCNILQSRSLTTRELLDLVDSKRGLKKQVKSIEPKKNKKVDLTEEECSILSPLLIDEGSFLLSDSGEALVSRTVDAGLEQINREILVKSFDNKLVSDGLEDQGLAETFVKLEDALAKLNVQMTDVKEKRAFLAMRGERFATYREMVRCAPNPYNPKPIDVLQGVKELVADALAHDGHFDQLADDFPEPETGYVWRENVGEQADDFDECEIV